MTHLALLVASFVLVEISIEAKIIGLVEEQSRHINQRLLTRISQGNADLNNLINEPDLAAIFDAQVQSDTLAADKMKSGQLYVQIKAMVVQAQQVGSLSKIAHASPDQMITVTKFYTTPSVSPKFLVLIHDIGRIDSLIWSIRTILMVAFALILFIGAINYRALTESINKRRQQERQELAHLIEQRSQYLDLMMQLSSLMAACNSLQTAAEVVAPIATKLAPECRAGYIGLVEQGRDRVRQMATWGGIDFSTENFGHQQCWALVKGHHHASHDNDVDIYCEHICERNGNHLCLPLIAQGNTIGVLSMFFDTTEGLDSSKSIALAMAEQIGLALANMQLREHLERQAIIDPLTGLFNRRHMIDTLETLNQQIIYGDHRACVVMLDVDHFKSFNDSFGHDAGDQLLTKLAMALKQSLREDDRAFRYGGEEFCIILPNATLEAAVAVADKIRDQMTQIQIATKDGAAGATISAGIAMIDDDCMDTNTVLQRADRALYQAKHNGRNRVEIFTNQRTD